MSQRGFTLLELLMVLGIFMIAAAVVAPSISSGLASVNLRSAAGHLAATLRYARNQAIAKKTICAVNLFLDQGSYSVSASAGGNSAVEHLGAGIGFKSVRKEDDVTGSGVEQFFFTQRVMPAPGR